MFGAEAKISAANREPPQVENELQLLADLRLKLGPHADNKRLIHHIRAARGKLHWAVNSYFREVLSNNPGAREDFEPRPLPSLSPPVPKQDQTDSQPATSPLSASCLNHDGASPSPATLHAAMLGETSAGAAAQSQLTDASSAAVPDDPAASSGPGSAPSWHQGGMSSEGSLDSFSTPLLEEVMGHLGARDLCQAAQVSRAFRKAASSNVIWKRLFRDKWGSTLFPTEPHLAHQQPQHHQHNAMPLHHAAGPGAPLAPAPAPGFLGHGLAYESHPLLQLAPATSHPTAAVAAPPAPSPLGLGQASPRPLYLHAPRSSLQAPSPQHRQHHHQHHQPPSTTLAHALPTHIDSVGTWPGSATGDGSTSATVSAARDAPVAGPRCSASHLPTASVPDSSPSPAPLSTASSLDLNSLAIPTPTPSRPTSSMSVSSFNSSVPPSITSMASSVPPSTASMSLAVPLSSSGQSSLQAAVWRHAAALGPIDQSPAADAQATHHYRACTSAAAAAAAAGPHPQLSQVNVKASAKFGSTSQATHAVPPTEHAHVGSTAEASQAMPPPLPRVLALQPRQSAADMQTQMPLPTQPSLSMQPQPDAETSTDPFPALEGAGDDGNADVQEDCSSPWRASYTRQAAYMWAMMCPRCGGGRVVPIVYGFPSPKLLEGMRSKRLILGGDHLIENCHVWACTCCNSSFRSFPYENVDLWVEDLIQQAGRPTQQSGGMPTYTYEL